MDTHTTHPGPWLLTVDEVAEISRRDDQVVRLAIRSGKLRASKTDRRYLITCEAVGEWLGFDLDDIMQAVVRIPRFAHLPDDEQELAAAS